MQKNFSPNPCGRKNPFFHTRGSSASTNKLTSTQYQQFQHSYPDYSSSEIESFTSSFKKILQRYIPSYNLPNSKNFLTSILSTLPQALDEFYKQISEEIAEQYAQKEESYQRTSKNLVKYEELLKGKAQALEDRVKDWKNTMESDIRQLETEKTQIMQAKVRVESELGSSLSVLKDKESQIFAQISEIELLRTQLHREKLQGEEIKWKLDQYIHEINDKEAILDMKGRMLMDEKQEFIVERSSVETQRMVNEIMVSELLRSKSKENPLKRPGSSVIGDVNQSLISDYPIKPRSSSRGDLRVETSLTVGKSTFINFINSKNVLERSAEELKDLRIKILPDLNKTSDSMSKLMLDLKNSKVKIESLLQSFNEKYEKIRGMEESIEKTHKELEEYRLRLQDKEKGLDNKEKEITERELKLELDIENTEKEKIEFFEDMHEERKRIEDYYVGIEEKVQVLDMKRVELKLAKKQLDTKQLINH